MIRINLLPPELQRAARTPAKLFFTLVGGVAATMLVGVAVLWLWIDTRALASRIDERRSEIAVLKEQASEVDRINEDIAYYKEREQAIIQIKTRRILWAPKLDQLVQLTPPDIWITRMEMKTLDPGDYKWGRGGTAKKGPQTGGRLSLTCYAKGTDVSVLTRYRSALSGEHRFYKDLIDVRALPDNFFGDFLSFTKHAWSQVELDGYAETSNLRSVIEIDLKPLYEKPQSLSQNSQKG